MPSENKKIEEMKLEEAMRRLDEVVKTLDSDRLDLDESLRLYEEGVRLVRVCRERLSDAERRISALRISEDGEMIEEAFDKKESV